MLSFVIDLHNEVPRDCFSPTLNCDWSKTILTPTLSSTSSPSSPVIISRQQRRMQVMRIRQRDDRYRKKKKKQQQQQSSAHHHQAKQLHMEPAYRRKPNPIRRYDTDVLSPVRRASR